MENDIYNSPRSCESNTQEGNGVDSKPKFLWLVSVVILFAPVTYMRFFEVIALSREIEDFLMLLLLVGSISLMVGLVKLKRNFILISKIFLLVTMLLCAYVFAMELYVNRRLLLISLVLGFVLPLVSLLYIGSLKLAKQHA